MDPFSQPGPLLEDFGQKVDLTRRIREVLVNYPEGTTVLKELIQNADDAGATKVCLCLDRRSHGTESLLSPALRQWQGPALLAYNDAVFTEDDFVSISRIGDSKKQGQAWKTGRFGVGFNSVYHLTDLPSFVSDKYVVMFDPQGAYLPNVSAANPGKRLDYVSSSAISLYKDQFVPYCAFGCDMTRPFHGTLFRFPLRSADQAAVSKLSRQAYAEDDISSMFFQLYKEAVFSLLFLKSVISVETYIWEAGVNVPQKMYSCSVVSPNENTAWHRQALVRFSTSAESSNSQMDSFSLEFLSEATSGTILEKRIDKFFIIQTMASASSKLGAFATTAGKEYDLHLLPWASIAAHVSDSSSEDTFLKQGLAFCFLPLPVRTGLTVQVNGYFEVSSNRRSIWFGTDMDRGGKLRSDWNRLLLEDAVAPAFSELLLSLRKLLGPTNLYYSLWPSGSFEEPWDILVEHIYKLIYLSPVLHSDAGGGKWISPAEAYIHEFEFCRSTALREALILLEMPIVNLPKVLIGTIFKYYIDLKERRVSPETVRHFLKRCRILCSLSSSYKFVLLDYILGDLSDTDVAKHANGLPLIPLANGKFGNISEASQGTLYYICDELEYQLLSVVSDKVIDRNIPFDLFHRLSQIASGFKANLAILDGQNFLQLFPRLFPAEWKYKNRVSWDPELGTSGPTAAWFVLFWQYLQDRSYDLSIFSEWPIFPSTSGHLYRASKSSKLLNAVNLSSTMENLLAKIGCKIVNPIYGVRHPDLALYVYDGDAAGVLSSIFESLPSDDLQILFQEFSAEEKTELYQFFIDPKWYYGGILSDLHIKSCRKLPIFRIHGGGDTCNPYFANLDSPEKYLPPADIPEYFLGGEFILTMTLCEEEILVRYYGIERMRKAYFYKYHVMNRLDELQQEMRDVILLTILKELPQLCMDDSSFKESLRALEFIPTMHGSLNSPQSLYDPRVEELYALLEESDCFPCGLFQEPGILDMLLLLGLRTSVSSETIIQSARQIESLMHKDQFKANLRGKVLLSYLEVNAGKWLYNASFDSLKKASRMLSKVATAIRPRDMPLEADLEKFWTDLRMICWCPVMTAAPHSALPWPSVSSMVAPPKLVRLQADMWLVSASRRILDGECSSSALSFGLGWSSPPGGSVIAAQVLELGKNNEIVTDQMLRQELALAMPKIYSLLTNLIGSDEMDIVKAVLEGCRWIWVGDGFATVTEVVLSGHLHLAPYIRVIPVDLAVFRELFLELGVKEYLKPMDYAEILCRMASRKNCSPLDGPELRAAILVVQHLAEVQFQDLQVQIYLPDVSSRLIPAVDLVFNDAPWLLDLGENTSNASLNPKINVHNFVHGNISNDVAEKLGVRSLRRLLLAESSDSMNLSLSGAAEAFGQHEALTTRLKHIVDMYADGPGILFELVQNAEDARASEVVFLLDKTQYGTSSILSPELAEWQGPALYCFNNSVFTPHDLYAISRIGQDSKLEKPCAIGRFGLGFNCVYHFTDIPSFVSGDNIVLFDPHACYLPGISPTHPGLRIKFVGRRILDQFPDQFSPFLHFGCDLQQSFPGTLFRFPLRSETAASRSQIKKEKYASVDVELLFSSFSEVVAETLLFLRNVQKISVFVKEGPSHEMQLVHCVSKQSVSGLGKEPHPLNAMLNFINGRQQKGMDKDQFLNKLGKTLDRELPWHCQKVVVMEQSPNGCTSHHWIISECIGGGNAKSKSLSLNRSHNFFPWGSVAAYMYSVSVNGPSSSTNFEEEYCSDASLQPREDSMQSRKKVEGRAFCFLPLPVVTGLPVHINAYFELSSNRRDIWFGNDMAGGGKIRSEWNICLLEDVISPAYGRLLACIAEEIGPSDLFFTYWPTSARLEPMASMVHKLYLSIADLGIPVLYTKARGGQWISTRQAILPDFTFSKALELSEALSAAGLPMVTVPEPIVNRFMEACPSLHFLNPSLLRTLLIRRKRAFNDKEAIIITLEYCLSDMKGSAFSDNLLGLPLVPLATGSFSMFSKRGEGERIFIASPTEYDLLKDYVPHLLVDCLIPSGIFNKLQAIARSGLTNIFEFTCHTLVELFHRILPVEWQHAKQVTWVPNQQGQPSLEWMGLLWSYLKSSCIDLKIFSQWPILPVGRDQLFQLSECSNVIRDEGWSENMTSLLHKVGCVFLRSDLTLDHPQLKNFVQDATASGILNAIQSVCCNLVDIKGLFLNASRGEMHELRSFILQSKWFSTDQIDSKLIETIKHLPIFESYKTTELISLTNPTKWLKPEGIHEDLLDGSFIRTESDRERNILRCYIGIKEASRAEFYREHVLNHMSRFLSQPGILSAILHDVKLLMEQDASMRTAVSKIPFVLAADGSWKHPSRLYDPRAPGLQNLLHREVFFPCDKFSDDNILEILTNLGLKRALSFTGLLDSARSVSMLHDSGHMDALTHTRRLLVYLNALGCKLSPANGESRNHDTVSLLPGKDDSPEEDSGNELRENWYGECDQDVHSFLSNFVPDISEDEFWSELKTIAWCPVYVSPPFQGLPWLTSDNHVAPPSITRPKSQMWMVSAKMRILDCDCCATYIHRKLGWLDSLNVEVLSTQLVELSKSYNDLKLQHEQEQEPSIDSVLEREMPLIYSKLQGFIGTDDFDVLKEALDGVCWVWIGDNFISPKALAFDSPVKYHPYLYAVPSELSQFRDLLSNLGVKLTFDAMDYLRVLQCLKCDLKGESLTAEQLSFVHRVLEAFVDCSDEKQLNDASMNLLLIPDSFGVLMHPSNLVYNDAPWLEKNGPSAKHFVHPCITNDLAKRLGAQSLRCSSLVDEEMTSDLPCMDYARICDLLAMYGDNDSILFDLLELADCCKAKKMRLIYDKREHPRQSLLQHNLGDFQGPSLTVVLEGAALSREDLCCLQFPPPWKIQGNALNYGLGLISSYFICDLLTVISSGYFFIFDPLGLALTATSSSGPSAKLFSLIGTGLLERFHDQFSPMLISQGISLSTSDSTVIRMPLSSKCLKELENGSKRVKLIFDRFKQHASSSLLFLKSVLQVSLSTWEEGNSYPSLDYSVSINPSLSIMRNPFSEKKWRKFQLYRLFSTSTAAIKMHVIDVHAIQSGRSVIDKWLVVLCLGSGQTRNMALDRRYLAYNLTPVAGVAAHISQNGQPMSAPTSSCILSPLPLSGTLSMPVTALGCFLVCHNGGRYLFNRPYEMNSPEHQSDAKSQLAEAWNKELLLCIRDAYVEMVLEFQKLRKDPLTSSIESNAARAISFILNAYGDKIYYFWPKSRQRPTSGELDAGIHDSSLSKSTEADWESLIEQVIRPFYVRLVDLPVWQLYNGNAVKSDEGMFLSQPGSGNGDSLPPSTVCSFIKEHYPVFSVPWELVRELQAVGVKVREIKPKMVRNLLKSSKSVIIRSIEAYIDVLDYCLSDIQLQHSSELVGSGSSASNNRFDEVSGIPVESVDMSIKMIPSSKSNMPRSQYGVSQSTSSLGGGDALEMVTYFGRALYDFGRGVVEDIGRAGGPLSHMETAGMSHDGPLPSIAVELKGMPFPTATNSLARLGITELWVGNKDQQLLMRPLADNFIHIHCLEKALLAEFLSDQTIHKFLKLKSFSSQLLSVHMRRLFDEQWVNQVISNNTPWISWDSSTSSAGGGPTPEWIRLFWKVFKALKGDLSSVSDWPLIPAFLNRPVLCRIKENHLVFVPPINDLPFASGVRNSNSEDAEVLETSGYSITESDTLAPLGNENVECELSKSFEMMKSRYPWLLGMLNQLNVPVYDMTFVDSGVSYFFPAPVHSLAKVILSKLISCKHAGYLAEPVHLLNEDRDRLFALFAADFTPGFVYKREEVAMLRELPIYKTVTGTYTKLSGTDQCFVSPTAFFHPHDERCLSHLMDSSMFLCALGVKELNNQEVLVKFALPGFEQKNPQDQEDILLYLYMNWKDLHLDSSTVDTLKETKFVRNAVECCLELFKPSDLLDPSDPLLTSVFSEEQNRFPEERFASDGWLQILRKAGLRTSSQADMIVECARKVELLGKRMMTAVEDSDDFEAEFSGTRDEVSFELWSLAGSIVDSMFSNFATLYDHSFCEKIGKIAFVPSEKGFPSISGKKGGKRVLASFAEAILLKDWPLAWSSAPIITKHNVIPPEYSWGAFHFRSPPVFSIVLKHLQVIGRNNGEDTLAHWPTTSGMMTIEEASFEILKYLDKIWGTLSSSEMTELQKVAFIPVANGTRLVAAKSLFVRLTSNLAPFAFELPSLYLPFVKILKEIGIQEVLTIAYARDLLLNIQKSCGYQRLNPNELRAIMEILNFICDGESRTRSERSEWIFDAIVPDDGCRLVLARSCVYVDPYGSQFLGNIETSRLRFSHPELSENICLTMGIKKLSDVVIEDLDDELQLQVVDQIGTIPVKKITEKLLSRSFQDAVWILVNSLTIHFPQFKGQPFAEIQSLLGNIAKNLQFVQVLHTRFLLLPKYLDVTRKTKNFNIPEWEGSRKHQAIHFVDKSKARILVANPPSYMSINDVIAVVISQILEAPTSLPIGPLFACPDGSEKAILYALKLGSEIGMSKNEGMNGTLAGKELLPQDALLVQFLPMRPFYAGEIVAWKTGMDGDTLRYGRVPEDVRPTAGQALYRLPVETTHGEGQILLSTQIFSFKSVAFEDEASMSCSNEASEAEIDNRVLHIQENRDCGNGKIAHQAAKELQYGKVSSTEIVQAVHDMLSAAGINMDAEKQTLLQTTLTLQEQVKDSQVALLVEQERADAAIKEADAAKAAWSCRICLSAEVNTTIVPCGHVLCHRCSSAVTRCPFCRSQVSKTMKIFRP